MWRDLGAEKWVVQVLRLGYRIQFAGQDRPLLTTRSIPYDAYGLGTEKRKALDLEVDKMLQKGAIEPADLSTPGFYSLLFLQPKPGGKWRPILDLSPVNQYVTPMPFKMETAATVMAALSPGEWATSLDLTDAFFHIPIAAVSRKYLRFHTAKGAFQFRALPFGLTTAPAVFTRVTKCVGKMARAASMRLHLYFDDWLSNHPIPATLASQTQWLVALVARLGLVVNEDKSEPIPAQTFIFVGILFNLVQGMARPAPHRVEKFLILIQQFLRADTLPASKWQQLLGHMASLEKLVARGRLHMRPFQDHLRGSWNQLTDRPTVLVSIPQLLQQELQWWGYRPRLELGVSIVQPVPDLTLFTDASHNGWGAHLLDRRASGIWTDQDLGRHINWLELQAVFLALRRFLPLVREKTVQIMTDNTTVVGQLRNQGGTKSRELTLLTRQLLEWTDSHQMVLVPRHIPGKANILADQLSRRGQVIETEWSLHPQITSALWAVWDRPMVDLFATSLNAKLPTYVSPVMDSAAWRIDALSFQWEGLWAYAFPPSPLMRQVLSKVKSSTCRLILIAPLWPTQEWFPDLLDLLVDSPRKLPDWPKLLVQPGSSRYHRNLGMLQLHAWLLSTPASPSAVIRRQWLSELPLASEKVPPPCTIPGGPCGWIGRNSGRWIPSIPLFPK